MLKGKPIFIVTLLILFFLPANLFSSEWNKSDTIREVGWQIIHFIDWKQTLYIADNPDEYYEINPILGKHPSKGKINGYMIISSISHAGISYLLPPKYREIFQYISIGVSSVAVISNFNVGIQVRW